MIRGGLRGSRGKVMSFPPAPLNINARKNVKPSTFCEESLLRKRIAVKEESYPKRKGERRQEARRGAGREMRVCCLLSPRPYRHPQVKNCLK